MSWQNAQVPIPQLTPLLEKIDALKGIPDVQDVYALVHQLVISANTPAMAQSACSRIITMTHPKAWGDQVVSSTPSVQDWDGISP